MDSAKFNQILGNRVRACAQALARYMYHDDVSALASDEIGFVVALTDCFFVKYLYENSPYMIDKRLPLQVSYDLLRSYTSDFTFDLFKEYRNSILDRYILYEQQAASKGTVDYTSFIPLVFAILAGEASSSTAKANGRRYISLDQNESAAFFHEQAKELAAYLPDTKVSPSAPYVRSKMSSTDKAAVVSAGLITIGRLIKLALMGFGIALIWILIERK